VKAECGSETAAAAVEAWDRCLERCRAGVEPEGGLGEAVAKVLPRGGLAALRPDGLRLVRGAEVIGEAEELPDEVLIGWAYDAAASESSPSGYDRLILDLLEAGFRPVAERAGLPEPVAGQEAAPPFRVVRARRDGYRIRNYRSGDEQAVFGLFRETFGVDQHPGHWAWRFLGNPRGGPRISLAFSPDGELVGQYCAYPVRWRGLSLARHAESHQVGDTMTRPSARTVGRGPTSLLARTGRHFYLTHCRGRVAFNYGFNTGNITKFSCRFLEAAVVEDVPYRELSPDVRLGSSARLGARYEVRRITERSGVDAGFDALFERVCDRYGLLVERSAEYLRWRYLDCPAKGPELVAAYRQGRLAAWVVATRHPDRVVWGDALVDPAELPALRVLLGEIRAPGHPIVGWFSERPRWWSKQLDSLGFVRSPEPDSLVTIQVPFVCGDALSQLRGAFYTKGDSDLF
jgi:hypothetical protein